jgi:2-C-methyl-D-erythritol 4-phosphate cytidylyltransferase/2-C-methyl-D-erythritol 2,4-cyclodiphosphate synthase
MVFMRIAAVIVAAGRGERAGSEGGPKQYRELAGKSVFRRALEPFLAENAIERVLPVIHADDEALYRRHVMPHLRLLAPAIGGATRQESVLRGLRALSLDPPDIVLIHDAARPFLTAMLLSTLIAAARTDCGVAPGLAVTDTLKRADQDGRIESTVARERLWSVQTPQCFGFSALLAAHEDAAAAGDTALTDDCAVAERAGIAVRILAGDPANAKITTAADLEKARLALAPVPDIRTAQGYDVHRLVPGDHVTLCGVRIAHDATLEGHSDADVGLHALTDALLGTIGSGDIGSHFPPSDPQWRGAASSIFLAHAARLVGEQGGRIANLDVSLICEAPKIGPHREAMRQAIAAAAGVDTRRVAVKATTNEGIGFVGRREGIAALASATVVFGGGS